jgi:hypothetical protein
MNGNNDKLKSWGFFLAGLGIVILGIAFFISVIRCPKHSKFKDFFQPPFGSTATTTVYSSSAAPLSPIKSSQRKLTDEEFNKFYSEFTKGLSEVNFKESFLEGFESEEFKEELRRSIEESPVQKRLLGIEKRN